MHHFKDFGITPQSKGFEGDKIKIEKLLNKEIIVEAYKVEESKFKDRGSGKRLTVQIIVEKEKRIFFSGSINLIQMLESVPKDKFPFITTIVKEIDRLQFT